MVGTFLWAKSVFRSSSRLKEQSNIPGDIGYPPTSSPNCRCPSATVSSAAVRTNPPMTPQTVRPLWPPIGWPLGPAGEHKIWKVELENSNLRILQYFKKQSIWSVWKAFRAHFYRSGNSKNRQFLTFRAEKIREDIFWIINFTCKE